MKFTGKNLKSDHYPVILHMDDEEETTNTTKQHSTTPSTKGWIPKTIAGAIMYKNRIMHMISNTTTLQQAMINIQQTASTIPHTTLNSRKRPNNTEYNKNIRKITAEIARDCHPPETLKLLVKKRNRQSRLRRNNNNNNNDNRIKNINSSFFVNNNINQLYTDNNIPIPPDQILPAAEGFGNKRFNNTNTDNRTNNNNRINRIMNAMKSDITDGIQPSHFSFFDTMQARARLRAGKGQAKDGTTNEMILCLPYYAILQIHIYGSYTSTKTRSTHTQNNGKTST